VHILADNHILGIALFRNVDVFLAHSGQLDHGLEMVATLVKIECG